MSVSTTAYSIDAKTLKKLKHDEDNFAFLFGDCDDDERWETERYDFDTNINFYVSLFRRVGLETVGTNIDSEASELGNYDAYDIWFVPTKTVAVDATSSTLLASSAVSRLAPSKCVPSSRSGARQAKSDRAPVIATAIRPRM